MRLKIERLALLALLFFLPAFACANNGAAPVAAPEQVAPKPASPSPLRPAKSAPARADWEVEWDKTVEAAKAERTVVLYTGLGGQQRRTVTDSFQSEYGISVESVTGRVAEIAPKIFAEQRAGIYSGDTWVGGSGTYIQLRGALDSLDPVLVLPELTQAEVIKKTWYFGELPWGDKAHTMLIGIMDVHTFIGINTSLVKAGEIKSYSDLLDSKWKDKILLDDPRVDGMGRMWFSVAQELGDVDVDFLRQLVTKQGLALTRDRRLEVEWLARGKYAITIAPYPATVTEFLGLGAPIDWFRVGTPSVSGDTGGIGMMKGARHPNAAKLFVNWLLSKDGQTAHSRAVGAQAQRLDVSTAHLARQKVLEPGLKPFRADSEEFSNKRATFYTKLASEVFGP